MNDLYQELDAYLQKVADAAAVFQEIPEGDRSSNP
jgi:hypothetical protein